MRTIPPMTMLLAALAISGCAAFIHPGQPPVSPAVGSAAATFTRATDAYDCTDGTTLLAQRQAGDGLLLFLPAVNIEMRRLSGAAGPRYRGDGRTFRVDGEGAVLEHPDGRRVECRLNPRRSLIEDARLRGVDYWAVGNNDPGWILEIGPGRILLASADGERRRTFPARSPEVVPRDGLTAYHSRTADREITVEIADRRCRDDADGAVYPATVTIRQDGTTFRGCGLALH